MRVEALTGPFGCHGGTKELFWEPNPSLRGLQSWGQGDEWSGANFSGPLHSALERSSFGANLPSGGPKSWGQGCSLSWTINIGPSSFRLKVGELTHKRQVPPQIQNSLFRQILEKIPKISALGDESEASTLGRAELYGAQELFLRGRNHSLLEGPNHGGAKEMQCLDTIRPLFISAE
ncbi:unnamed protein product, partial [Pleuronectes platessa]